MELVALGGTGVLELGILGDHTLLTLLSFHCHRQSIASALAFLPPGYPGHSRQCAGTSGLPFEGQRDDWPIPVLRAWRVFGGVVLVNKASFTRLVAGTI
jgi:hypothetical protein